MTLTKYANLIAALPTGDHAFTIDATIWHRLAAKAGNSAAVTPYLKSIFGTDAHATISRNDLINRPKATIPDFERFLIATLMWGYPLGGRGNNICNVLKNLSSIATFFHSTCAIRTIPNWISYLQHLPPLPNLGLSTHTKLLYFMGISVQGYPALILDARIKDIIWSANWQEFTGLVRGYSPTPNDLRRFSRDMDTSLYVAYLSTCARWANALSATHDQIEFFLFTFGRILK